MITSWKRDYVRVLKISPDGRLNEMLNLYKKLKHAGSKDSWGGLCRTANSKRKAALASKVNYHITWYLEQRIPALTIGIRGTSSEKAGVLFLQ